MKKIILTTIIIFFIISCYAIYKDNKYNKNISQPTVKKKSTQKTTQKTTIKSTVKATQKPKQTKQTNILISGFTKRPIINGFGDKKIGEYGYKKISKDFFKLYCDDKTLIDFAKFSKKQNVNYIIIDFSDNTGLHGIDSFWTYCRIKKDNECYTGGKYIGSLAIYSNEVDRSDFDLSKK